MATLAETLGVQGIQQTPVGNSVAQGIQNGIQLAGIADQVEQKKLQTEQMKAQLDTIKFNKAMGSLQTLAKTRPDIAKRMVPKIKDNLMAAGIPIDPNILDVVASDEDYKRRILSSSNLLAGLAENDAARVEGLAALSDFGLFETGLEALSGQAKSKVQEDIADKRLAAQLATQERIARTAAEKANKPKISKGQEKVDTEFAKTFLDWEASGGVASVERQLETLEPALEKLQVGKGTGTQGLIPKVVRDIVDEEGASMQDAVESVVQSSMKQTLGAQFTEKEGAQILARAYNPRQTPSENAKRVRALVKEIKEVARAKQAAVDFYKANGSSLSGYKGKTTFSIGGKSLDIKDQIDGQDAPSPSSSAKQKFIEKAVAAGATPEVAAAEAAKRFGN